MEIYSYSAENFACLPEGTYYNSFNRSLSAEFIEATNKLPEGGIWVPISDFGISVYCHPECGGWGYIPMNFFRLSPVWHIKDGDYLIGENILQGGKFKVRKETTFEVSTNKELLTIHRSPDGQFKIVAVLDRTSGNYGDYSFNPDFKTAMEKAGYELWEPSVGTEGLGTKTSCGSAIFSIYSPNFGNIETVVASGNNPTRHSSKKCTYLCPSVRDMLIGKKILTAHTEYYVRGESFKSEYLLMS